MTPGQLGPTSRDLDWLFKAAMTCVLHVYELRVHRESEVSTDPDLVGLGNTLSDANNQANLVLYGLDDSICRERRGDINDCRLRLSFSDGLYRSQ